MFDVRLFSEDEVYEYVGHFSGGRVLCVDFAAHLTGDDRKSVH